MNQNETMVSDEADEDKDTAPLTDLELQGEIKGGTDNTGALRNVSNSNTPATGVFRLTFKGQSTTGL